MSRKPNPRQKKRSLFAETLEPRVLLSAAPIEVDSESPDVSPQQREVAVGEEVDLASVESAAASAIERWKAAGISDEQVEILEDLEYYVEDIQGNVAALAEGQSISVDIDANGRGWFVDGTPMVDEEFSEIDGVLSALEGSGAESGIDLVSVLMHEQGHILGLLDHYQHNDNGDVMYGVFTDGERRLIEIDAALGADALSLDGAHYASLDITVTTELDVVDASDGLLSLREAIIMVNDENDGSGVHVIRLDGTKTYLLDESPILTGGTNGVLGGDLDINIQAGESLTILGNGATVQADFASLSRADRVFETHNAGTVTFDNLTISGGRGVNGAGVRIGNGNATTNFDNVTFSGNEAGDDPATAGNQYDKSGGAVEGRGTVTFTDSTLTNNAATRRGGAVWMASGTANFVNTDITNNVAGKDLAGNQTFGDAIGGGIWANNGSQITFDADSSISGNTAVQSGGGIRLDSANTSLSLNGSTLTNNTAETGSGGGIYANGIDFNGTQSLVSITN
ncbi:MAG: LEPR-XLL domain-containing protein, partial [Verrucomicrobiota bacterium]